MVGRKFVMDIIERILERSGADSTEVVVMAKEEYLTRYADSSIHQNTHQKDTIVSVRVAEGARIGCSTTNDLSRESLDQVVSDALAIARSQRANPDFPGFPEPSVDQPLIFEFPDGAVRTLESEGLAKVAVGAFELAGQRGLSVSGSLSSELSELGVGNSLGIRAYSADTRAFMTAIVQSPGGGTGYSDRMCRNALEIDALKLVREAVERCEFNSEPQEIEPGRYDVILLPYATADLVSHLGYMGMGAQSYQEGRSFLRGKMGERVFGENVSIWDDGLDPNGLPMPFDFEGVPKKRVELISDGVARGVVHDSYTAAKAGTVSTGHALPPPNTMGPLPCNLYMGAGDLSMEDLLSSTKRGILVTRFHYIGIVHPQKAVFTGMTRDGTFLVENGEITRALKNLRFSQNMITAFNNVTGISDSLALEPGAIMAVSVPAVRISDFEFTGATG